MISEQLINEALLLDKQIKAEKVAPKLEVFRKPAPYKLVHGGRGSGKSWGIASLLIQDLQHAPHRLLCAREIQLSLEESVYQLLVDTIDRLQYDGWTIKKDKLENVNGSKIIFRGLKDLRAANAVKSMEGIDRVWLEEAHSISRESFRILLPTIRADGAEVWASWNPESEDDPVNSLINKPGAVEIECNWQDNPWFTDKSKSEMESDYNEDPDEAEHTWGGQPRKQGADCILSRVAIRAAMERNINPVGAIEMGVDVARYGNDSTTIWTRHGLKVIGYKELRKSDTIAVADAIQKEVGTDRTTKIKIDEGYNPGVIDVCRSRGLNIINVSFGAKATEEDKYPNIASEMWFNLPIEEMSIPDNQELLNQLADRRYKYDSAGRRCVEAKDDYKKRHGGKSPDKADGLILCFYQGLNIRVDDRLADSARRARMAGM